MAPQGDNPRNSLFWYWKLSYKERLKQDAIWLTIGIVVLVIMAVIGLGRGNYSDPIFWVLAGAALINHLFNWYMYLTKER